MEIHGFADAFERAYAVVAYLRTSIDGRRSTVTLLAVKTKVAPVQRISLPRLELYAAMLLAKVVAQVQGTLILPTARVHLWSDSYRGPDMDPRTSNTLDNLRSQPSGRNTAAFA